MRKKNSLTTYFLIILLLIMGGIITWLLINIFEKKKPTIIVRALPRYISSPKKILLIAEDEGMGLKEIRTYLIQKKKKLLLFYKKFPCIGILNKKGKYSLSQIILLDPAKLKLSEGEAIFEVHVKDHSKINKGKGNLCVFRKKIIIDTTPPIIRPISRLNYFSVGGAGLITYEVSKDTIKSGVYENNIFFLGYPINSSSKKGIYCVCYIAIPYNSKLPIDLYIWAKDKAGNISTARFYYKIKRRRFRKDKINITDNFLKKVLPFFSFYSFDPKDTSIQKFLRINRELRKKNNKLIKELASKTSKTRLWKGPWISLRNAACTARFADHRTYFYKGKMVDQQVHLGLDLASIANSNVLASNSGKVVFIGRLGIYGLSVIIDHGQSVFSLYGHLSRIDVKEGQNIKKGDVIGITGQTGLAGGDHLHFSIIINGIFVNPEEWLDYHWLRDNIIRKLRVIGCY